MGLCDKGGVFDILTFHACLWDLNLKGLWLGTWEPKLQKPNNWQIYIWKILQIKLITCLNCCDQREC